MALKRIGLATLVVLSVLAASPCCARAEDAFKITPDIVYGHKAGMALTFDVVRPDKPNGAGVLFMVSGGFVSSWGPPEDYVKRDAPVLFKHFRELVELGYTLFIVRHGSSPQFKVPEVVADVRRAVRYIRTNAEDFGIDANRIGVFGGSAGGHLSLMLGVASDEGLGDAADSIERASDRVAAVVAYCPPVDLKDFMSMKDRFPALDFDPQLIESVSPLFHVTVDDAPTLLIHGDKDDLVKIDNSQRILAEFEKDKVPCELIVMEGAGHGFGGEQSARASKALIKWFDKYLAAPVDNGQATEEPVQAK